MDRLRNRISCLVFPNFIIFATIAGYVLLTGCGGGGGNNGGGGGGGGQPTVSSVAASCATSTLKVAQTDQCTANVQGTNNPSQSVTWSVNSVAGGNSAIGIISASGLYTAPTTVPSPAAVSITATSTADTTKSGNSSITVTLSIGVSPTTATVQLFHPQQFNATVSGVSNTAVNWQVNGTAGGNSTNGTIDTNGLYTPPVSVPTPGAVSVTAISQADPTQSASASVSLAADSTAPTVVSTTPASGATSVSVQPSIQIVFNEGLDPATVTPSSFILISGTAQQSIEIGYSSSDYTVTLAPVGLLTPGANYTVQVAQSLHDLGGNALASPFNFSFQVQAPTNLTGTASFPQGIDPTTTIVSSFRGQQSVPNSAGNFNATIGNIGSTLIGSSLSANASALLVVGLASTSSNGSSAVIRPGSMEISAAPGIRALMQPGKRTVFIRSHQITASAAALNSSSDLAMDFQTTAEALLFYSPALMRTDPQVANQILTDIAADPNTTALATALSAAWSESHPMQDPTVSAAYTTALQSILQTVVAQEPALAQAQATNRLLKMNVTSVTSTSNNQSGGNPQITPFSVCCISMPPFTAQGSNYTSNFTVKFGRASGWFMRVEQMPTSFDPSQLQPVNGSSANPDSPGPVSGENQQGMAPAWIPGNSVFQYGDLLGDIGSLVSNVVSDVTGLSPANSSNVTLPATPAAYYLVRFYSGGTGDPAEIPLVSSGSEGIYAGQQLWRSSLIANDITVSVDLLNATNLIPSDIVTCEATALIPEVPNIASDVGFQNAGWNTFMQVSGDVWTSFADNFGSCFASDALGNVFEMLGDASKLASVAGTIIDGLNSVSQASDAIQIVTESAFDPPVDTAFIQVGSPATGSAARIVVTPSSLNLSVGTSGSVAATAYDGSGNPISNAAITWSIGNTSIASMSANGSSVQVTGESPGTTQLTATTTSGAIGSISVTISASTSAPSVGGVLPNPVPPLTNPQKLTINGMNFANGATLSYYDPVNKQAYPNRAASFINSGQLVDTAFNNGGDAGTWTVTVVNPGNVSSTAFSFTVSASDAAPTISSVSPNPVPGSNTGQTLQINGGNFQSGATLTYHDPQGNAYTGRTATFVNSGQLIDPAFNNASDGGTWTVTVVNPGGSSSSPFSFSTSGSSIAPTLTSLTTSPSSPIAGQQFTLTLNGTGFDPSTIQILIWGGACGPCTIGNATITTKTTTQLDAPVNLSANGSYNITVQNGSGGGQSGSLTLVIGTAVPSITQVSTTPSSPAAGQQFTINISGNNFNLSSVQVLFTGPGCTPCSISNSGLTTKNATLLIGTTTLTSAGSYTVTVQNGPGGTQSNGEPLTIGGTTPSLNSLTTNPNSPIPSQQFTLTLNGSNFDPNSVQILVYGGTCAPCTIANGTLTTKTVSQVVAPVTLTSAGSYNIYAQNSSGGGQSNSLTLVIGTATPSLTQLVTTPSSPAAGQQFTIDITGNNFDPSSVQILFTGPGCAPCTIPNSSLTTKNATLLIGSTTLTSSGSYTVTAQNGSSGTQSNNLPLTIGGGAPSLSNLSTSPSSPVAGQQFILTLNGSNFDPNSVQILINGTGCAPCTVNNAVLSTKTATQVIGPVTLNSPGSYAITVQNGSSGTQSNALSLTVSGTTPALNGLSTNPSPPLSNQQFTLTLNGSNFDPNSVQILINGGSCGPCTIANGLLSTKTASQVVAPVTLATAGSYNITVQNGAGGGQSNALTLVIGTPTPTLNSFVTTPSSPAASQQFTIDLSGSNFDPSSAQVLFTGPGCAPCTIPNANLTTKNATLLIGSITLSSTGSFTVTVQNGSSGTQSNGLPLTVGSVTPSLSNLSTNPNPPVAGQQFTLTLNGTNFTPSSIQLLIYGGSCGPCTVANGTLTSKTTTQVVAPVTLSTAGSYNIYAQNGSGGGQSNSLTLVIGTPTPSLSALVTSPSSPTVGQQFTIDISGNNFDPNSVQILFMGSGCSPCTIPNSNLSTKNATLLIGSTTLGSAGNFTVTVQNGASGPQSNSLPLTIGAAGTFTIGEYVKVSGTGGVGLNLRSCANTTCSLLMNMPDGTVMQVIAGPTTAAGYTWWELSGTVGGTSYTGWAIQDYLIAD